MIHSLILDIGHLNIFISFEVEEGNRKLQCYVTQEVQKSRHFEALKEQVSISKPRNQKEIFPKPTLNTCKNHIQSYFHFLLRRHYLKLGVLSCTIAKITWKVSKFYYNKTKYTMDPGIYYLLEADEDNTNRY